MSAPFSPTLLPGPLSSERFLARLALLATPATTASILSRGRWTSAPHLELLASWIADLAHRQRRRVIVSMPPRHGKSQLVSHWTPVWYLAMFPERRVILASYEADFAASWGRLVRNTLEEHQRELGVKISADSSAANRWDTPQGGGMITAGVGGPITGRGADLLILDDPIKNAEEANSERIRQRVWEWWQSTAYTRLEPGAGAVVVMTRWHQDDLVGRLLRDAQDGGEAWDMLELPALAEPADMLGRSEGSPLWPARYGVEDLGRIKRAVGSYVWAALYQQRPAPASEGSRFQRAWFGPPVEPSAVPAIARRVRYWDLAATEAKPGTDPDWTAGVKMAEQRGAYWIESVIRARARPKGVEDLIRQTAELDGVGVEIHIEQEPGSSGVATIDHYQRDVLKGFAVYGSKTTGDKQLRANPLSAAAEAGNVKLVRGPWVEAFLEEAEAFPGGAHDDQVDAASGAMEKLATPDPSIDFL